jgi:hypothetical protein
VCDFAAFICCCSFHQRRIAILDPAADGQDTSADAWRDARGLEYLHAVFQCMLLGGYSYALIAARRFSLRIQMLVQLILLLSAVLLLPVSISTANLGALAGEGNPIFRLLWLLLLTIGLPFFILSTHGPLLQNWFSKTSHPSAKDPYFL